MMSLRRTTQARRSICVALLVLVATWNLPAVKASITFTPGHLYTTWEFGAYDSERFHNINEYDETGNFLGSLVVHSLVPGDQLLGIAFGPDGLLYAVRANPPVLGFSVLVLDRAGAVHNTYVSDLGFVGVSSTGKIAVDQQYIFVALGNYLIRFTIGDPSSGVVIYGAFEVMDVNILPNGHLFVASSYVIDEITNTGEFVRNVVSDNGFDFIDIRGIQYDPVSDKLFVAQLGSTGSRYSLMRLNPTTGAIETGTWFDYGDDLFLTQSDTLFIGNSALDVPRVYNKNCQFVRTVGDAQRTFVTQYIDFANDGRPDFYLWNSDTRQNEVWYLDHGTLINSGSGPTIPPGWKTVATGDFNRDGRLDYLLLNSQTLETVIWYLDGARFLNANHGPTLPRNWQVVGTGDFNGDGYPDLVLINPITRETVIWYLRNNVHIAGNHGPTLIESWSLVGVADFNGDGYPDYLLSNASTGATVIWYMRNNVRLTGKSGPTLPTGWTVAGVADFNGDAYPDYLLINPVTGATVIWYMQNNVHLSSNTGPILPAGWTLLGF